MEENRTEHQKIVSIGALVDTHYHALDAKRRLTVPSEWRDAMGNPDYVYVFPDAVQECLDLVPVTEMEAFLAGLRAADIFDDAATAMAEAIAQHAQMLKIDTAGRIRIGDALLGYAGIVSKVTLVGAFRTGRIYAGEKMPEKPTLDLSAFRAAMEARKAARMAAGKSGEGGTVS